MVDGSISNQGDLKLKDTAGNVINAADRLFKAAANKLAVAQMYAADIASIAATATYGTAGTVIDVSAVDQVWVQLKATGGNASATGAVTAYIVASVNGTDYSTVGTPVAIALNGTTAVIGEPVKLLCAGVKAIKVLKVINGDASYTATAVNVIIGSYL
jgi:hypothetical protein